MHTLTDIAGWIGTGLILLAYFFVSTRRVEATGRTYQLMNLFGALFLGVNVYADRAWPALALEAVWLLIAVVALARARRSAPETKNPAA